MDVNAPSTSHLQLTQAVLNAINVFSQSSSQDFNLANEILVNFCTLPVDCQCPIIATLVASENVDYAIYGWNFLQKIIQKWEMNGKYQNELQSFVESHYSHCIWNDSVAIGMAEVVSLLAVKSETEWSQFHRFISSKSFIDCNYAKLEVLILRAYLNNMLTRESSNEERRTRFKEDLYSSIVPAVVCSITHWCSNALTPVAGVKALSSLYWSYKLFSETLATLLPPNDESIQIQHLCIAQIRCFIKEGLKRDSNIDDLRNLAQTTIVFTSSRHPNVKMALIGQVFLDEVRTVRTVVSFGVEAGNAELVEIAYLILTSYTELLITTCRNKYFENSAIAVQWMECFAHIIDHNTCLRAELKILMSLLELTRANEMYLADRVVACLRMASPNDQFRVCCPTTTNDSILYVDDSDVWNLFLNCVRMLTKSPKAHKILVDEVFGQFFEIFRFIDEFRMKFRTGQANYLSYLARLEKLFKVLNSSNIGRDNSASMNLLLGKLEKILEILSTLISDSELSDNEETYCGGLLSHLILIKQHISAVNDDEYIGSLLNDVDFYLKCTKFFRRIPFCLMDNIILILQANIRQRGALLFLELRTNGKIENVLEMLNTFRCILPVTKRVHAIECIVETANFTGYDIQYVEPLRKNLLSFDLPSNFDAAMSSKLKFDRIGSEASKSRIELMEFLIVARVLVDQPQIAEDVLQHIFKMLTNTIMVFNNWRQFSAFHVSYCQGPTKSESSIIEGGDPLLFDYGLEKLSTGPAYDHPNTFFEVTGDLVFGLLEKMEKFGTNLDWSEMTALALPKLVTMQLSSRKWLLKGYNILLRANKSAEMTSLLLRNFFENLARIGETILKIFEKREEFDETFLIENLSIYKKLASDAFSCASKLLELDGVKNGKNISESSVEVFLTEAQIRVPLFEFLLIFSKLPQLDYHRELMKIMTRVSRAIWKLDIPHRTAILENFTHLLAGFIKSFTYDSDETSNLKKVMPEWLLSLEKAGLLPLFFAELEMNGLNVPILENRKKQSDAIIESIVVKYNFSDMVAQPTAQ